MDSKRYDARIRRIALMRALPYARLTMGGILLGWAVYGIITNIKSSAPWIILLFIMAAPFALECATGMGGKDRRKNELTLRVSGLRNADKEAAARNDVLPMLSKKYRYDGTRLALGITVYVTACVMLGCRYYIQLGTITDIVYVSFPIVCMAVPTAVLALTAAVLDSDMKRGLETGRI